MNWLKKSIIATFLLISGNILHAQNFDENVLRVQGKGIYTSTGKIVVRWAPINYKTWLWGRDSGYIIKRYTLVDNNGPVPIDQQIAGVVTTELNPWPQSVWEGAMQNDQMVGVAAGANFGENIVVSPPGTTGGILNAQNLNSEKENRFGMSLVAADNSFRAAFLQNLLLEDNAVNVGFRYLYIIRPKGDMTNEYGKDTKIEVIASNPYQPPVPEDVQSEPGDSLATITWNQAATEEHYTSYNIYRSKNGGTFEKVNGQPVTPTELSSGESTPKISFMNKLENNTDTYAFQVIGHTPFGIDGPPSQVVTVKGKAEALKANFTDLKAEEVPGAGMALVWGFPDNLNNKIQGFNVLRSAKIDGTYTSINSSLLGPESRKFLDETPLPSAYYEIEFVDLNDNKTPSVPILGQKADSIPPLAPDVVSGEPVGTDGTLRIHWRPSKSIDAMGYRVFLADQPDGAFGQVTSTWVGDTVFLYKANANSLSELKYFKVKAVDFRENSSEFSPLCTVKIADVMPPSLPVMKKAEPKGDDILVEFAPSLSPDVKRHHILRKKKEDVEWTTVIVLDTLPSKTVVSYLDTSAQVKYGYDYMIQAEDDAQLLSNSKVFSVKNSNAGARDTVSEFKVKFVKSEEAIQLSWEYMTQFGISSFIIYRGLSNNSLFEVGSVTPAQILKGGSYGGPDPFANNGDGVTNNPYSPTPGTYDQANIGGANFNVTQGGAPNTTNTATFEYHDASFSKYKKYYYAVVVKFNDGSSSAMNSPKVTSTY